MNGCKVIFNQGHFVVKVCPLLCQTSSSWTSRDPKVKNLQKVSPLQIHKFHPFELKILLQIEGPNRGGRFSFFFKNSEYFMLENQNTEHFAKSLDFLDPQGFAKPAKPDWYKVSKKKKNVQPKLFEVSPKKISARSDLKWLR